jgi:hypothetical protein
MSLSMLPAEIQKTFSCTADVVFLLDDQLLFIDVNEGWKEFASANGGSKLSLEEIRGSSILSYTPKILRTFYVDRYVQATRSLRPVHFEYHCSSPEKIRLFRMEISYVATSLLVVNHLVLEEPCPLRDSPLDESLYLGRNNLVTMCANCRKTRQAGTLEAWDWVPEFLEQAAHMVSHGLCPRCLDLLYGP